MQLGYRLDIDINDFSALHNAVDPYLDRCRQEIAKGNTYPFEHDLQRLENLLTKLIDSREVTSRFIPAQKPSAG